MNLRQKVGHKVIHTSRKYLAGSFIQKWKITSIIYMKVFDAMYGKKDVEVSFRHARFIMPTKDITLTPSVMSGDFEREELDIFESVCKKGDTIIDVGANIGLYSVLAAKHVGDTGRIHAFEPIPFNLELLQRNIVLNQAQDSIEVHQAAVGESVGHLDIFLSDRQVGTHSAARRGDGSKSIKVPMQSIDNFVKTAGIAKVNVIKVDVEGYDGQVLKGATKTLKKFKPCLFVEYSPSLLKACGQEPGDFIDSLTAIYGDTFIIVDEFNGKFTIGNTEKLQSLKIATNVNLVFDKDIISLSGRNQGSDR